LSVVGFSEVETLSWLIYPVKLTTQAMDALIFTLLFEPKFCINEVQFKI